MFEMLMEMLTRLEDCGDVMMDEDSRGFLDVTFMDFEGFDDDWCEVMREYEDDDTVEAVFELLQGCPSDGGFYCIYDVEGRQIRVGFASYDI